VLLIAALSFWQTREIPTAAVFAAVGPQVFPWIVTAMLAALGVALLLAAFRGGWAHDQDGTLSEWAPLGLVLGGLIANALLIEHVGFILASTIMFVLVARGFESRQPLRDAVIGFVLAGIAYVGFDRVLGYKIGSGLIESLI
jgi:putative tricarboxylic transport membrane protein